MGEGSEQHVNGGFIWKEGILSSLVSGTRQVTEYGAFGPRQVSFEAVDKLGRTIRASGQIDHGLIFTGYTDHTVVWSLVEWDWDGVPHWGDNQAKHNPNDVMHETRTQLLPSPAPPSSRFPLGRRARPT